jgi:hypothetical protein
VAIVPKKTVGPNDGEGRTRSVWASDALWEELQLAAKREGYSVSKFVGYLLRFALDKYQLERASESGTKPSADEKP